MYIDKFGKNVQPEDSALRGAHKAAMALALSKFEEEALGTGTVREDFKVKLISSLDSRFEEHRERLCMEAELRCREILVTMEGRLQTTAFKKDSTPDSFFKVLEEMVKDYEGKAVGPAKWSNLAIFLKNSLQGVVKTFVSDLQDNLNTNVTKLEEEKEKTRYEKSRAESIVAQLTAREDDLTRMKRRAKDLEEQLAALGANQSSLDREKAAWLGKLEKANQDLRGTEMELEALRKEIGTLKRQIAEQAELLQKRDTKLAEMTARVCSQTAAMTAANEEKVELRLSLEAARQKLKAAEGDSENWRRRHSEAMETARKEREDALTNSIEQRKGWEDQREKLLQKKESEYQLLKVQYSQQIEEVSRLSLELEDVKAQLLSSKQALAATHLQVNVLHGDLEAATQATASLRVELQSSRELQAVNQRELEKIQRELRQAEHAKVGGDLLMRRKSELLQQSTQDLEKSVKEQAGLTSEIVSLKARNESLEKDLQQALLVAEAQTPKEETPARDSFSGRKRRRRESGYASTVEGIDEAGSECTVGEISVSRKMTKNDLRSAIYELGFGDRLTELKNATHGELMKFYSKVKEGQP